MTTERKQASQDVDVVQSRLITSGNRNGSHYEQQELHIHMQLLHKLIMCALMFLTNQDSDCNQMFHCTPVLVMSIHFKSSGRTPDNGFSGRKRPVVIPVLSDSILC